MSAKTLDSIKADAEIINTLSAIISSLNQIENDKMVISPDALAHIGRMINHSINNILEDLGE